MLPRVPLLILIPTLSTILVTAARASFSVHFPWGTRAPPPPVRLGLRDFLPFCGDIIHNPQPFSAYQTTFVSFSGNPGDLVSVHYTRNRAPRSRKDFSLPIVADVPIAPSGQLCINITMPPPSALPEFGVLLFEAQDSATGKISFFCGDVKLRDIELTAPDHPAMCARNNETLIPMPDAYL